MSCSQPPQTGEELANVYCASCHQFPDPGLLDKKTWQTGVLPRMALRLGFITDTLNLGKHQAQLEEQARGVQLGYLPAQPVLSVADWKKIVAYYAETAPDSLPHTPAPVVGALPLFTPRSPTDSLLSLTTFLHIDPATQTLSVGTSRGDLFKFDSHLNRRDSLHFSSAISDVKSWQGNGKMGYLLMGIMTPNDKKAGSLQEFGRSNPLIDSLYRPVQVSVGDLNHDGQTDLVVCEYGHNVGQLSAFFRAGNGYRKTVIDPAPGARQAIIRDLNADGWADMLVLFAQGDEQVTLFTNQHDGTFQKKTLLRFPPVYGSSYLELADINGDGQPDLICTNGDNADYSQIVKPYHGIRVYLNDGKFGFKQAYFYPMPGAGQVLARDFDNDGDLDLAAISAFPDFSKNKPQVFVYLENKGKLTFTPRSFASADAGRWLVMTAGDLDHDGDEDIALGAYVRTLSPTPAAWNTRWQTTKAGLLVLNNQYKDSGVVAQMKGR
ncbi:FG-GAP repeat domain-containing protein [Fibrella rubiginis]|uniref:FG-GAP repeat domain-containing protein n=1 Tax=Fibrella rubiginis TaxID=2817060 RepID=UPI001E3F4C37|nr:VCBS repeat-containing protein [Fibrella rubiginis]